MKNYLEFVVISKLLKSKISRIQTNKELSCSGTDGIDNIWNTSKKYSVQITILLYSIQPIVF